MTVHTVIHDKEGAYRLLGKQRAMKESSMPMGARVWGHGFLTALLG